MNNIKEKLNQCIRLYSNGSMIYSQLDGNNQTEEWLKYNKKWRWGCALFVNGVCDYMGQVDDELCFEIQNTYRKTYV